MNCCASFLTSVGTWMFFSGFVTSTAGSFENVSLGLFALFPTKTAIAAIAPANNIRPATHGSAFRQKGTWRVALEGRGLGLVVVVLIRLGMVDGRWLRKVRASRKNVVRMALPGASIEGHRPSSLPSLGGPIAETRDGLDSPCLPIPPACGALSPSLSSPWLQRQRHS